MSAPAVLRLLLPWEFSPTVLAASALAVAVYLRGLHVRRASGADGVLRPIAFLSGVASMYAVMQTHLDYLAQHMFWIHRVQHLVLHHLGPFLIALSAPAATLGAGLPPSVASALAPLFANRWVRGLYRNVQRPAVAAALFVGLVYFWLIPAVHFYAMLSLPVYEAMNWSMAIDGLLFWWLIFSPRGAGGGAASVATRMAMLVAVAIPQAILGAYITFRQAPLYDVYDLCGRAWSISPRLDQQLGGLNTWIPPGMMSALGLVVLAARWMRSDGETRRAAPAANAGRPLPERPQPATGRAT